MTFPQLAPEEPLSPELVLVLPPELRAEAIAALPYPRVWTLPRRLASAPAVAEPVWPFFAAMIARRALTLAVIFVGMTLVTVALALVAQATR